MLLALSAAACCARSTLRSVATVCLVLAMLALGTAFQWTTVVRPRTGLPADWPGLALATLLPAVPR